MLRFSIRALLHFSEFVYLFSWYEIDVIGICNINLIIIFYLSKNFLYATRTNSSLGTETFNAGDCEVVVLRSEWSSYLDFYTEYY